MFEMYLNVSRHRKFQNLDKSIFNLPIPNRAGFFLRAIKSNWYFWQPDLAAFLNSRIFLIKEAFKGMLMQIQKSTVIFTFA